MSENNYLDTLINKAISTAFERRGKIMNDDMQYSEPQRMELPYSTVEEYKNYTGKRFRMKKDQKQRGLDREEAFREFLNEHRADHILPLRGN
jgi:hypothetical protein